MTTGEWFAPAVIVAVAPLVAAAVVWLFKRLRRSFAKLNRAGDIILGTPEERDPLSGAQLRPAVPDIGTRTATMEHLLAEVVVGSVQRAEAAAEAAAAAAHAAALSASAAREIAVTANATAGETRAQVAEFANQLNHWQTHDRVDADAMRAVLTDIGIDTDPPVQQF